jgi:hypothetical protein
VHGEFVLLEQAAIRHARAAEYGDCRHKNGYEIDVLRGNYFQLLTSHINNFRPITKGSPFLCRHMVENWIMKIFRETFFTLKDKRRPISNGSLTLEP